MGAGLTRPQREVYIQVVGVLKVGRFHFSKGLLKHFVRWIFAFFPNISAISVKSVKFWDQVGENLAVLKKSGDDLVGEFFPLLVIIYKAVKDMGS